MISVEMPKYRSHKVVWALKIKSIVKDGEGENRETDGSAMITPEEEGYAPFRVDHEYMHKHKPEVGGYYVVYKDGYKSFSPAVVFEEGNTPIGSDLNFGEAIRYAKKMDARIARRGWNGQNMFVFIELGWKFSEPGIPKGLRDYFGEGTEIQRSDTLWLKTAQDTITTWTPSSDDVLAEDWYPIR